MAGLPHYKIISLFNQRWITSGNFCPSCGWAFLHLGHSYFKPYDDVDTIQCYCGWSGIKCDLIDTTFPEYPPVSDLVKNRNKIFTHKHLPLLASCILLEIFNKMHYKDYETDYIKMSYNTYHDLNYEIKCFMKHFVEFYDGESILKVLNECILLPSEKIKSVNDISLEPKKIVYICSQFFKTPTFIINENT